MVVLCCFVMVNGTALCRDVIFEINQGGILMTHSLPGKLTSQSMGGSTGTLKMELQIWLCFVLFLTGRVPFFALLNLPVEGSTDEHGQIHFSP